jgi:uncharacterized protein YqeY
MKAALQAAVKEALKARDKTRLDTLRLLLSAIQYEELEKKTEPLPTEGIISVLQREVKKRREEIEYAQQAGREEQLAKLNQEIQILEEFLPKQLSAGDLEKTIVELKQQNAGANMGAIMKLLKERHAGQYDGKLASEIAKRVL